MMNPPSGPTGGSRALEQGPLCQSKTRPYKKCRSHILCVVFLRKVCSFFVCTHVEEAGWTSLRMINVAQNWEVPR